MIHFGQILGGPRVLNSCLIESLTQAVAILARVAEKALVAHRLTVQAGNLSYCGVLAELRIDLLVSARLIGQL